MIKKKIMKPEALFESQLKETAPIFNCAYIKIPDTHMINLNNRYTHRERKRPFDGIIITPKGNWCVELKYQYAKLLPHQAEYQKIINMINKSFVVIRKLKTQKMKHAYRIQFHDEWYRTDKIEDIFIILKEKV